MRVFLELLIYSLPLFSRRWRHTLGKKDTLEPKRVSDNLCHGSCFTSIKDVCVGVKPFENFLFEFAVDSSRRFYELYRPVIGWAGGGRLIMNGGLSFILSNFVEIFRDVVGYRLLLIAGTCSFARVVFADLVSGRRCCAVRALRPRFRPGRRHDCALSQHTDWWAQSSDTSTDGRRAATEVRKARAAQHRWRMPTVPAHTS